MIQQIETYKLIPHPGNPRKSMGDISELSDSIKENGIFQNLTVVPMTTVGVYRVVIGHRRLEAAIQAGLESVPCVVVEMDEKTQLSTMLLENMTRSDLTPYEQAQGIQQCLDIGMTETEISKKTGFSKSTVKRRLKILELDANRVKDAQGSLEDYIALESIEDVDVRNELLKHMGTNNFLLEVEKARMEQTGAVESDSVVDNPTIQKSDKEIAKANSSDSEPAIVKLSRTLRLNFMKEVFKRKIAPNEIAVTVGYLTSFFIDGSLSFDLKLYYEIINPNGLAAADVKDRMLNHRSNYFVIAAYVALEKHSDINKLYKFIEAFGYVMSDDEKEMLPDA